MNMQTILVRVVLFCGITFITSVLLAVPYLALPKTGECAKDQYGYVLRADTESVRIRLACTGDAHVMLGDVREYGISR